MMEELQNEPLLDSREHLNESKSKKKFYLVSGLCVAIGILVGTMIGFISFSKKSTSTTTTSTLSKSVSLTSNGLETDFNSLTIYQIMVSSFQGDGSSCYWLWSKQS